MSPVGVGEDRRISDIYAAGEVQSDLSPVEDGGGENLCHVHSKGHSVTHVPSGGSGRRISANVCAVGDAQ